MTAISARSGAILAVTAALGACGGGGGTPSGPLSRAQLAAKANSICAAALKQGLPNGGFVVEASAYVAMLDRAVPILDQQTTELRALVPAPAAAKDWRDFVSAAAAADRLAQTERTAALKGSLADVAGNLRVLKRLVATATKVGARTCVNG